MTHVALMENQKAVLAQQVYKRESGMEDLPPALLWALTVSLATSGTAGRSSAGEAD